MEMDERVDYIEGEINLIKGEIQQALVELRDMVTVMETKVKEPESQVIEIRQGTSTAADETAKPEKAKNEIEEVEESCYRRNTRALSASTQPIGGRPAIDSRGRGTGAFRFVPRLRFYAP